MTLQPASPLQPWPRGCAQIGSVRGMVGACIGFKNLGQLQIQLLHKREVKGNVFLFWLNQDSRTFDWRS
jgi:hypothetical protein